MVKAVLSKKRGAGRGADGPGAEDAPNPVVEKAKALLREVWEGDLPAVIPVLERYARGERDTVSFMEVAEACELVADLMAGSVGASGDTCDATDVAVFIHNEGEVRDGVEALFALTPIARRVQNRLKSAKHTAELQETLAQLRRREVIAKQHPGSCVVGKGKKQ